jgi:hypothetical protein
MPDRIDDLFQTMDYRITVGNFAALSANPGGHVLDNHNAVPQIGSKCGKTIVGFSFAHKTGHGFGSFLCCKSSDHSSGLGKYAVMSHNSIPFEPQTMCNLPALDVPKTKQLGKG